jgi:hypothetical protein
MVDVPQVPLPLHVACETAVPLVQDAATHTVELG